MAPCFLFAGAKVDIIFKIPNVEPNIFIGKGMDVGDGKDKSAEI